MNQLISFDGVNPFHYLSEFNISTDHRIFFLELTIQIRNKNHSQTLNQNQQMHQISSVSPVNQIVTKTMPDQAPQFSRRRNELWKSTCFEAFIRKPNSNQYLEINFSPEGFWNCYEFSDIRIPQPPREFSDIRSVAMSSWQTPESKDISGQYQIKLSVGPNWFSTQSDFEVGLTGILTAGENQRHYYALKHVSDRPDFHKFESFILKKSITPTN